MVSNTSALLSSDAQAPGTAFHCTVQRTSATEELKVAHDGAITFTPLSSEPPSSGFCCLPTPAPLLAIPGVDVIGASRTPSQSSPTSACDASFSISYCPAKTSVTGRVTRTLVSTGPLCCDGDATAEAAVAAIRSAAVPKTPTHDGQPKTVFGIVNSHAGRGRGMEIWGEAEGMLRDAGIPCKCLVTERPGHASEELAAMDMRQTSTIALVGGDGSVHEALQGLLKNAAWQTSLGIPICHIPAGSGNGLSASLGLWTPVTAVHALIKGFNTPMDAATTLQPGCGTRLLSFLALQHGRLTNLDVGTENLRSLLGGERFTFGAVREILKNSKHKVNIAWVSENSVLGTHSGQTGGSLSSTCTPSRGPPTPILDTLTSKPPLVSDTRSWPTGWMTAPESHFTFFNTAGLPWASLDFHVNPWAEMCDGLWEFVRDAKPSTSRAQQVKLLLDAGEGKHKDTESLAVTRVKAMALEPVNPGTWITVDGEVVPYEPIYLEVHQGLLTVVIPPLMRSA